MADTTDLYFDLPAVLRLAEHATNAPEHALSYSEHTDGTACPGGLEWVCDAGVYLMSTGLPCLPGDNGEPNLVTYAHGWGPDDDHPQPAGTTLGGDDFAEHLHLNEPLHDRGGTLLAALRDDHARGHRYLVLKVDDTAFDIAISRDDPPDT